MISNLALKVLFNEQERYMARHNKTPIKISAATVRAIRAATGTPTMIAEEFGVSRQYVGQIRLGKTRTEVK